MALRIGSSWDALTRINELVNNLRELSEIPIGGYSTFDYLDFVRPVSILPIACYVNDHDITISHSNSYLERISFPEGIQVSNFHGEGLTFIPITKAILSSLETGEKTKLLDTLSYIYPDLLSRNIEDDEFLEFVGIDVFHLLVSEMIDNILEHSNANAAYAFSQFWTSNNSCEICLLDNGVGIFESLKQAGRNVQDDMDALKQVIKKQLSAKDEFGTQRRGTGIKNTIRLLANNELNGYFCVVSGSAGYFVDNKGRNKFVILRDTRWQGTIISMGFQKPSDYIDIYEYIR